MNPSPDPKAAAEAVEIEIDWSDEPVPVYANGAQVVHTHREFSIAYTEFVKKFDRQISAEDILDKWSAKVKAKVKAAPQEQLNGVLEKVVDHSENGDWTQKQVDNAFKFMKELPGELVIAMWTKLTDRNFKNAQKLHKQCSQLLLEVIGETNN